MRAEVRRIKHLQERFSKAPPQAWGVRREYDVLWGRWVPDVAGCVADVADDGYFRMTVIFFNRSSSLGVNL